MAQGEDEAEDAPPAVPRQTLIKRCDPPESAFSLSQFVRDEAGAELAAIKVAFERLAEAHGSAQTSDAFAAAVHAFHERARRRLLIGEVLAYGTLPDPWCPYGRIPPDGWRYHIWGNIGDFEGFAGFVKAQEWRPSPPDHSKMGYFDTLGPVVLWGGWDLVTEVAFTWMTNLRLDDIALGACTRPFKGNGGWHVLGLEFASPPQRLVHCLVADAASMSPAEACTVWLRAKIAAGPKQQSKKQYRDEAISRWPGLSWRAFDRIWGEATQGAKGWGEPGRPRK